MTEAIPPILRSVPWRFISGIGRLKLDRVYCKTLEGSDPRSSVAYFWPDVSPHVVEHARGLGFLTVREMINCYRGTAKRILDSAHQSLGLPSTHGISSESVELERRELQLYDYVFASNICVEESLREAGVEKGKILPSSFGWLPSKYQFDISKRRKDAAVFLFVGTVCVRKGVPNLLEAWKRANIPGTLVIAGAIDKTLMPYLAQFLGDPSISFIRHVNDPSTLYSSADVFIFPTLEEGGPQVVYEAAAAGLPVITTKMGQGRIIKDRINGIIVDPGNVEQISAAIVSLSDDSELRTRLGDRGMLDAARYDYKEVGAQRAGAMAQLLLP